MAGQVHASVEVLAEGAAKFAKLTPPKPISGRWGSVSECERRVLASRHFVEIFVRVMGFGKDDPTELVKKNIEGSVPSTMAKKTL